MWNVQCSQKIKQMTYEKLEKLSAEMWSNSGSFKYLTMKSKNLEESLTVNQDLVEDKIKSVINWRKWKKLVNDDTMMGQYWKNNSESRKITYEEIALPLMG